jgi:uroporphyrinogen-III synthase
MRVLVTRPFDDAEQTVHHLTKLGHETLTAPLLEIRFLDGPEIALDGVQAVLVTSGNAMRALARRGARRDVPLFAVGSRTAAVARAHGFGAIEDAAGNAKDLSALVRRRLRPEEGKLLHAAGTESSGDLVPDLVSAGYDATVLVVYESVASQALPADVAHSLRNGLLDAVLVFSPRSARLFVERLREAGLGEACRGLIACCISEAAAEPLDVLPFAAIRIAARPDSDHIFALLDGTNLPPLSL